MKDFEKRKIERFNLNLPAWVSVTSKGLQDQGRKLNSKNICAGGAYFNMDSPFSIGTKVNLEFLVSLKGATEDFNKESHIDVSGTVIRKDDRGMAVQFNNNYRIAPNIK